MDINFRFSKQTLGAWIQYNIEQTDTIQGITMTNGDCELEMWIDTEQEWLEFVEFFKIKPENVKDRREKDIAL